MATLFKNTLKAHTGKEMPQSVASNLELTNNFFTLGQKTAETSCPSKLASSLASSLIATKQSQMSCIKTLSKPPNLSSLLSEAAFLQLNNSESTQLPQLNEATNFSSSKSCQISNQFIDPCELKKTLLAYMNQIILLDCRTITDFNSKHIKDSVHLNCRDKLIKKRLQARKLTVKDLISCQEIKNKFDQATSETSVSSPSKAETYEKEKVPEACMVSNNCDSLNLLSEKLAKITADSESDLVSKNDMIIIYDDKTSDMDDLKSDSNPLKIVQENIKQSGFKNECKILKGGFKQFFEMCPEYCVNKAEPVRLSKMANSCHLNNYDQQIDQHQSAIDNAVMTEIIPYLFLGNEKDAKNLANLKERGIYYILNVTKNIPFYAENDTELSASITECNHYALKRISVNDSNQNLKQFFDEAIQFIDEAKSNNSKVLVHCQAGISRSPTIVIAYLMNKQGLTMNDAYQKVREMRPIVAPNLIFMSQLMDYENQLDTVKLIKSNNFYLSTCTTLLNDKPCESAKNENKAKQVIECN